MNNNGIGFQEKHCHKYHSVNINMINLKRAITMQRTSFETMSCSIKRLYNQEIVKLITMKVYKYLKKCHDLC